MQTSAGGSPLQGHEASAVRSHSPDGGGGQRYGRERQYEGRPLCLVSCALVHIV